MTPIPIPPDIASTALSNASDAIAVRTALCGAPVTLEALKRAKLIKAREVSEARTVVLRLGLLIAATEKAERDVAKRPSLAEYNEAIRAAREAGENIESALAQRELMGAP